VSSKPILIHSCKSPGWDDGKPIIGCRCRRHVTQKRAETLVGSGRAAWKKTPGGKADLQSILLRPRQAKIPIPPAATIGQGHILRAVGVPLTCGEQLSAARSAYERQRIEFYSEAARSETYVAEALRQSASDPDKAIQYLNGLKIADPNAAKDFNRLLPQIRTSVLNSIRRFQMSDRALLRKRAALTQVELSQMVRISAPRLCLWERGQIELRPEQVDRIAQVLKDHLGKTPCFDGAGELVKVLVPTAFVPMEAA
jgi:DNA-binding transcriptional regulator YiaG